MEQFHYTWCRPGVGVSREKGWNIRSISSGLSTLRATALSKYAASYVLPKGLPPIHAPAKLAYIRPQPDYGILIHSSYVGEIPSTPKRWGNYYTHAIVGLPPALGALEAIATWRSSFWIVADDGGHSNLPSVENLPIGNHLTASSVREFLATPLHMEWSAFCVEAAWGLRPGQRLIVVGPPDRVAQLIHVVALCLPPARQSSLTFSTSEEADESVLDVGIVGMVLPSDADLPDRQYQSKHYILNTDRDRRGSLLPVRLEFARDAILTLADGANPPRPAAGTDAEDQAV